MELVLKISKFAERPKASITQESTFDDYSSAIEANSGYTPILEGEKFIGILTDGDIRRYIAKNGVANLMNQPASSIGNFNAKTININTVNSFIANVLSNGETNYYNLKHIPVLNNKKRLLFVIIKHKLLASVPRSLYSVEAINDLNE